MIRGTGEFVVAGDRESVSVCGRWSRSVVAAAAEAERVLP